ncbi:UDP-glycosyltransferase [Christiangramia aquimixticola]|uniref:UDP-glycosyltransferase n=1 Tax=Christiangramia aquimixticola TaxID=1697558 RepID=UPI003AA8EB11
MSSKKILIIAESINVEDSSGSKANVALILNLHKAGYKLLVLHYTRKSIQLPNIECVEIQEKKTSVNYFLSRLQRKIQHGFGVNLAQYLEPKFGFSFTFFNDVESIKNALENHKTYDPDLVLTLSKGASFRPHYAVLNSPYFLHKWLAYIHDPYPFHYYPEPYKWSEPGYQKKIDFFEQLSDKCKWVAYPSLLLSDWMRSKFPKFEGKEVIIPHQLIEYEFSKSLPEFFSAEKFTLLHAGNLMKQRPPFFLIDAFKKFLEKVPAAKEDAELLLIGNATYHKEKLQNIVNDIPQVMVKDYLNFECVLNLQKHVSVNIILESIADFSPFLPGKFPHCIAAERRILLLGPKKSESLRLLGEDYNYWSEADNEEKILEVLVELYEQWKVQGSGLRMNREDLKNYLSVDNLGSELEKILN